MLKCLGDLNDLLYDAEFVKSEIEHKEPIIVGFLILQYAKWQMLEFYENFFDKYCDASKLTELEMDKDSLYLALSGHDLYDCIRPAKKKLLNSLRSGDCTDDFSANSATPFWLRTCCANHKKHHGREPGLFKDEMRCTEMICSCSKSYCCYD